MNEKKSTHNGWFSDRDMPIIPMCTEFILSGKFQTTLEAVDYVL